MVASMKTLKQISESLVNDVYSCVEPVIIDGKTYNVILGFSVEVTVCDDEGNELINEVLDDQDPYDLDQAVRELIR